MIMMENQSNKNQDLKPLSINDDLPIQDLPINDFPIQDNRGQQIANALKQKSLAKNQPINQQQNTPIYQQKEEQAQQIQMLSNGIQYLQEELKSNQSISSGLSSILGTNSYTLKNITTGGLQDVKNFLLGGVEFDLNRNILLDSSKMKSEEIKLLQSYLDKLGIPYNAQKIKVRDMLQVYLAMSSENFHKVNNLDPETLNKIKDILKYRDFGGGNFVLTDAELEQIRQSAPDVFNRLEGNIQTFKNDLLQNKELNGALANSLAKSYTNDKQERAENSSNTMFGITVASLLISFSSILGVCGVVLTGFLATVVSFFPIISLAITIYTVIKKIKSLANNIESYNNEDKMKSVDNIGKILTAQSKTKQQQLNDQVIKNKVKIGTMQEQLHQQNITQQNPITNNKQTEQDNNLKIEEKINQDKNKHQIKEENKPKKKQKQNDNLNLIKIMPKMMFDLNVELANLQQKFQENQIRQESALKKLSTIKKPKKQTNNQQTEKKIEKNKNVNNQKVNSQEEILALKQDLMPKNKVEEELLNQNPVSSNNNEQFGKLFKDINKEYSEIPKQNQDSEFMSQKSLKNIFPDNQQHTNTHQNQQKEEMLKELKEKQQLLQNLLKQKEELEKKMKTEQNNNNNITDNKNDIQNQSFNKSLAGSFPGFDGNKQPSFSGTMPINPFMSVNHSHYQPPKDMYNNFNPNTQQPICNNQSHFNHQSINNQIQQGQGYYGKFF